MKRRVRLGAATLMVAAGLVGALAAPASAKAPHYSVVGTCTLSTTGATVPIDGTFTSKEMNVFLKDIGCVMKTVEFTRVRVP
jgi:hypothetical protein